MKRKLLILIGIALPALMWAGKSTPYSTIFYGDDEWTIIDANGDGKTWTKESGSSYSSADGASGGIKYAYNSSKSGDDWCISPAITLEAGKEYKLKIWEKAHQSSFPENYKVFLAQENT
ncbi:MAG: choice-of-anchor J domain-containing protein, partial [Candidatus Limisoma sp.]|nr:choice-of-anchor J domain-containing protein [Candidatus Limisoma sp.]